MVEKKLPSFSLCSWVVGGYHEMSAGLPSKKSGMNTRYFWSVEVARISAPWMVWSKKPKMSAYYEIVSVNGRIISHAEVSD